MDKAKNKPKQEVLKVVARSVVYISFRPHRRRVQATYCIEFCMGSSAALAVLLDRFHRDILSGVCFFSKDKYFFYMHPHDRFAAEW